MIDRWPAIAAIALCVTGLVIADQRPRGDVQIFAAAAPELMPVSSDGDALGSSWYCPAGLASVDQAFNHVVIITNPNSDVALGQLTVFPAVPDGFGASTPGDPIAQAIEIPANTQTRISLGAIVPDEPRYVNSLEIYLAALVEIDQPGVTVQHSLLTEVGVDTGSCASTSSQTWHFASGTTQSDVRDLVAIFNPFPAIAAVDIWFPTDSNVRRPTAYTGLVLPAQSVTMLDVRNHVPTREQMAMTVETRSGRVIVERIQLFESPEGPRGATLALGSPEPAGQWFFPAGRSSGGDAEGYVVYNPGEVAANLELDVYFDDPQQRVISQPLTVAPGQRVMVTLDESDNHPVSATATVRLAAQMPETGAYWVSVRSFNEGKVVVERITTDSDLTSNGVTTLPGAPLAGSDLSVAIPISEVPDSVPFLVLLNPAPDTLAVATVTALVGGERVEILELELGPRRRAVADLSNSMPAGAVALEISSSQGLIAELGLHGERGSIAVMAIPSAGTAYVPPLFAS